MKENKGVTLIALVITIVVLLILAGVALTIFADPANVIGEAKLAKEDTNKAVFEEELHYVLNDYILANYTEIGSITLTDIKECLEEHNSSKKRGWTIVYHAATTASILPITISDEIGGKIIITNKEGYTAVIAVKEGGKVHLDMGEKQEVVADVYDVWDGTTVAEAFESGDGTEETPYKIANCAQLAYFANLIKGNNQSASKGKYFEIVNNLDLNNVSWNKMGHFYGNINGNNHKIKNIKIEDTSGRVGFFSYNYGTIKNLILETGIITATQVACGGFVGENTGTISDCINKLEVTSTNQMVGGIVGYNYGGIISNCTNEGPITGGAANGNVGGIVGADNSATGEIKYCKNKGTVTITNGTQAGGIAGRCCSKISHCSNEGIVTSNNNSVGGIVGYTSNNANIEWCYNTADVTGATYVGGIVGSHYSTNKSISTSYNTGKITGNSNVAGISGYNGTIDRCYNTGVIIGNKATAGIGTENCTITNSYNTGDVTSATNTIVGGIAVMKSSAENCYNTGTIKGDYAQGASIGGILGDISGSSSYIAENCHNTGKIEGKTDTKLGAIVGKIDSSYISNVQSCSYLSTSCARAAGSKEDSVFGENILRQETLNLPTIKDVVGF